MLTEVSTELKNCLAIILYYIEQIWAGCNRRSDNVFWVRSYDEDLGTALYTVNAGQQLSIEVPRFSCHSHAALRLAAFRQASSSRLLRRDFELNSHHVIRLKITDVCSRLKDSFTTLAMKQKSDRKTRAKSDYNLNLTHCCIISFRRQKITDKMHRL